MTAKIDVHVMAEGRATVVVAKGDIDLHTSPRFTEQVLPDAQVAEHYVLDLSNVGFLDSTGIGALVRVRKVLKDRGLELHVVPSRRVRAALTLASLERTMVVHDSLATALDQDDSTSA